MDEWAQKLKKNEATQDMKLRLTNNRNKSILWKHDSKVMESENNRKVVDEQWQDGEKLVAVKWVERKRTCEKTSLTPKLLVRDKV